jgi:hypothetical protein
MRLEESDRAADGRGRLPELAAGAREASLIEGGHEDLHRVNPIHAASLLR